MALFFSLILNTSGHSTDSVHRQNFKIREQRVVRPKIPSKIPLLAIKGFD